MISHPRFEWLCPVLAVFAVAVALNYVWEAGQAFLFVGMGSVQSIWWHCFVASLGDGVILWIIQLAGWVVFRQVDWFAHPGRARTGLMLGLGLAIAVVVEWVAVHWLHRWAYTAQMPVIPGLEIGVTPVLQMLLLPPLIFWIAGKWCASGRRLARQ